MKALRYDYRDVVGAAGFGLRVRKWLVAFPALFIGVAWWAVCAWVALLVRGLSPALVWNVYGPVPWPSQASAHGVVPVLVWVVGALGLSAAALLASLAVGRMTYQQLKGNDFFSFTEAWQFARRKWKAAVLPLALLAVGAAVLVGFLIVVAAAGRLWPPLWGILFPLGLAGGFALLYVAVVFGVGCTMAPAIVAASSSETLETTFELFSLQSSQGKRTWLYTALGGLVATLYTAAMGLFCAVAVLLTSWVMDMGHAGAVGRLLRASLVWAPRISSAINGVPGVFDSFLIGVGLRGAPSPRAFSAVQPSSALGGAVVAVALFLVLLMLLAQGLVTFTTCQTTSYVVLRQRKDDQNLLEEDLEE